MAHAFNHGNFCFYAGWRYAGRKIVGVMNAFWANAQDNRTVNVLTDAVLGPGKGEAKAIGFDNELMVVVLNSGSGVVVIV